MCRLAALLLFSHRAITERSLGCFRACRYAEWVVDMYKLHIFFVFAIKTSTDFSMTHVSSKNKHFFSSSHPSSYKRIIIVPDVFDLRSVICKFVTSCDSMVPNFSLALESAQLRTQINEIKQINEILVNTQINCFTHYTRVQEFICE